jgi:hypothetical protein
VHVAWPEVSATAWQSAAGLAETKVEPTMKVTVPVGVLLPLLALTVAVMATVLADDDDHTTVLGLAVTVTV